MILSGYRKLRGFTIVELLAGMVIASILIIVIGTMMYSFFLNWKKNRIASELQSDTIFAMDMIGRAIRPAAFSDTAIYNSFTNQTVSVTGSMLKAKDWTPNPDIIRSTINPEITRSIYLNGGNFYYNMSYVNTLENTVSNIVPLILNKVTSLSFTQTVGISNTLTVTITLQDPQHPDTKSTTASFAIGCRN